MKNQTNALLLAFVASILFLTSCDKISSELRGYPQIALSFINEEGEDIFSQRVVTTLPDGCIPKEMYACEVIANGIKLEKPELYYLPPMFGNPTHLRINAPEIQEKFKPKDKQIHFDVSIKFPALFLDEEIHKVDYTAGVYKSGRIEYKSNLYFDNTLYQFDDNNKCWLIKIN